MLTAQLNARLSGSVARFPLSRPPPACAIVSPCDWPARPGTHLPPSCVQCAGTLSGGAEEAAAASQQEDQHLHRHLPRMLCALRDHQVSLAGAPRAWGGSGWARGSREPCQPPWPLAVVGLAWPRAFQRVDQRMRMNLTKRENEVICFCFSASDSSGLNLGPKAGETPHLISKHIILTFSPQTQEVLKGKTREKRWGKTACRGWFLLPTECRRALPGIPGPRVPPAQGAGRMLCAQPEGPTRPTAPGSAAVSPGVAACHVLSLSPSPMPVKVAVPWPQGCTFQKPTSSNYRIFLTCCSQKKKKSITQSVLLTGEETPLHTQICIQNGLSIWKGENIKHF